MKLKATCYKTPSCAAFVVVEDAEAKFASTCVNFTGTHSDHLAAVFTHMINEPDKPMASLPWWKKIFADRN